MSETSFKRYDQSDGGDWSIIQRAATQYESGLSHRVLKSLRVLSEESQGHPVDRLEHSLQTATRAFRSHASEEMTVCALLHDIGDDLSPCNHGPLAAAILRPYVNDDLAWLVEHHEIFQGYFFFHHIGRDRNEREKFRGHPAFELTADFCEKWDQTSFERGYDTMPLEAFEPMVHRLFAREPVIQTAARVAK
ncbi:MAG: HD domain-containing protein [Gammaproteobacteria bacterium]|nr:HD domain-containing protein [Gammaproteobacteria bacterium]